MIQTRLTYFSKRLVPIVLILVCIVMAVGAGWMTTRLKSSMTVITGIAGIASVVGVLVAPMWATALVMFLIYFAIFPSLNLGPVSISASTLPIMGLAFVAAMRVFIDRRSFQLKRWQAVLLVVLLVAFFLPTLTSESLSTSLVLLPNLVLYILILFAVMVFVRKLDQLVLFAKMMLVLVVLMITWRYVLSPVLGVISLSDFSTNGIVYMFYPGFAVAITSIFVPLPGFSQRWRWFAWLVAGLVVVFSIYLQSRAGWIALLCMLGLAVLVLRPRKIGYVLGVLLLVVLIAFAYKRIVQNNVSETVAVITTLIDQPQGSITEGMISSDDMMRVVARDAGLRMFAERPWTGWGPNMYPALKLSFSDSPVKYSVSFSGTMTGSFNAWLRLLAEMGVFATTFVVVIFLLPLSITARALTKSQSQPIKALAFTFALGVIGLSVHLLFIDLLYGSFVWLQLGLALAAVRVVNE